MAENVLEHFKANANPTFDTRRKGYDPDQVDAYVKLAVAAVATAEAGLVVDSAQEQVPTVHLDGDNDDLTQILTMARAAAARAISEAETEAEAMRHAAREEAARIVADARTEVEELKRDIIRLKSTHQHVSEVLEAHLGNAKLRLLGIIDSISANIDQLSMDAAPEMPEVDELNGSLEDSVDETEGSETQQEEPSGVDTSDIPKEEDEALNEKFKEFWDSPRDEDEKWRLESSDDK